MQPTSVQLPRGVRWTSNARLGELPLVAIATGPDGDIATGVLAIGGFARGGLAIGGVALGLLSPHAFGPLAPTESVPEWLRRLVPWIRH